MKKLILISALLFSFDGRAEDISGTMICTIKDQMILEMKDGVSKRYSGDGRFKVGDNLTFEYRINEYTESSELEISLGKAKKEENLFWNYYDTATTRKIESIESFDVFIPERIFVYTNDRRVNSVSLSNDEIDAEMDTIQRLILNRYYKNDWNGIFTMTLTVGSVYSASLDCRQGVNQYDELLEALYDLADEN